MKQVTKAIIYQKDEFLLQLRDDRPDIAYPNSWSFFGGEIELGETPWQALKRELGEVLIFNQNLPHGNRINQESETRWSMNCRFKSIFTPYGDKKIGEFFEPITLKIASRVGMNYHFPQLPSQSD